MRTSAVFLLSTIVLASCATQPVVPTESTTSSSEAMSSAAKEQSSVAQETHSSAVSHHIPGYKEAFMQGEIPGTWSIAQGGDVAPMPVPPKDQTWINVENIYLSFAKDKVSYGDLNWAQVDIVKMEPKDVSTFVSNIKANTNAAQSIQSWTTQTIGGEQAEVMTFKTNPDGSVDKGATGGAMYFFPTSGWIFWKQTLQDKDFEEAFAHFLQTIRFESGY